MRVELPPGFHLTPRDWLTMAAWGAALVPVAFVWGTLADRVLTVAFVLLCLFETLVPDDPFSFWRFTAENAPTGDAV